MPSSKIGRIFLAEDDTEMRRVVAEALRREGHAVIEVRDGGHLMMALSAALTDRQYSEIAVDLILTDVRMPECNGLDVVDLLRATECQMPVIVMTAFGDAETRSRAERLGAVLLDKPFRLDLLTKTVRELLG